MNAKVDELSALFHSSGPAPAPTAPEAAPVDPMAGGNDAWAHGLGKGGGGAPAASQAFDAQAFGERPTSIPIHTPPTLDAPRVNGRWALYDEKWITYPGLDKNRFDSKSPQSWLQ